MNELVDVVHEVEQATERIYRDATSYLYRTLVNMYEEGRTMDKNVLMKTLGYASVALGFLHARGVELGHLGNSDFIALAAQTAQLIYGDLAANASTGQTVTDAIVGTTMNVSGAFAPQPGIVAAPGLVAAPGFSGVASQAAQRAGAPGTP